MTQVDAKRNQDEMTVLRDILHIIATTPDPMQCVRPLLEIAVGITEAQGAALVQFADPQMTTVFGIESGDLPDEQILKETAGRLPVGVHINPLIGDTTVTAGHVLAQIRVQRSVVALLWLSFGDSVPAEPPALGALLNGFAIVAASARVLARHEKISRNQSEFMRIVSHDLRSPLTSMQGFGSMLESGMVGDLNEKQRYFVEKILSGIAQMTSLVENIQDAGRYDPETGFYEMQRTQCDLVAIVQRIVENHLMPAEKQELTVVTDIADDIPIISADSIMLERAITNLVDNAIKYTPNGGRITIGLNRRDSSLVVTVSDTGLGISPDNQKLLFERHVRIPRTEHKKIKGSGLGLFIVRSVAQRHGGNAWIESTEGQGSTFSISIPIHVPDAPEENDES